MNRNKAQHPSNPKENLMKANKNTAALSAFTQYAKPTYPHAHLPLLTELDVPSTILMQTLHRALGAKRAHGSMSEARFVAWLVNRLPVTMIDAMGNVHVDLRTKPHHRTMFTAHTDTVHHSGGSNKIRLDTTNAQRTLWRADEGECLGADDGAGVALLVHMIDAGIPALYVFFRGEEVGGLGSSWLGEKGANALKDIDRCISLDRADQSDVITHQAGGRCCSDVFAEALAQALTTDDLTLAFMPDSTGVFTDSANLTDVIPECTNLSVGYKHQHGDGEYQDVTFLQHLAERLCTVAWDDLPTKRDPKVSDYEYTYERLYGGTNVPAVLPDDQADVDFLVECLFDAAWGKREDLRNAVAEMWGVDTEAVNVDAVAPHEMDTMAQGLLRGTYTLAEIYEDLGSLMIDM